MVALKIAASGLLKEKQGRFKHRDGRAPGAVDDMQWDVVCACDLPSAPPPNPVPWPTHILRRLAPLWLAIVAPSLPRRWSSLWDRGSKLRLSYFDFHEQKLLYQKQFTMIVQ